MITPELLERWGASRGELSWFAAHFGTATALLSLAEALAAEGRFHWLRRIYRGYMDQLEPGQAADLAVFAASLVVEDSSGDLEHVSPADPGYHTAGAALFALQAAAKAETGQEGQVVTWSLTAAEFAADAVAAQADMREVAACWLMLFRRLSLLRPALPP